MEHNRNDSEERLMFIDSYFTMDGRFYRSTIKIQGNQVALEQIKSFLREVQREIRFGKARLKMGIRCGCGKGKKKKSPWGIPFGIW